jgi:hypothetical protein
MMKLATELPMPIATQLGQIIALWSWEEHILRKILANAAGTNIKAARVVFREPSTEAFANTIRDLLIIEDTALSGDGLDTFAKTLKDTKERRDILAHSLWGYDETGQLGIQRTRGTWNLNEIPVHLRTRMAKKVHPDFLPIDQGYLDESHRMLIECIRQTQQLDTTVAEIRQSLQQKHPSQDAPMNPPDQDKDTP